MLFLDLGLMALVAGLLVGLIGGSASLVLIPVLLVFFSHMMGNSEVALHYATTTSLAISLVSKVFSLWLQHKQGLLNWTLYKQIVPILSPGLLVGAAFSHWIPERYVTVMLASMMAQVGYSMLPERTQLLDNHKSLSKRMSAKIGVVSGLLGVSGNELTVSSLVNRGVDVNSACMMGSLVSSSVSFILVVVGMLRTPAVSIPNSQYQIGYLYLPAIVIMAPIAVLSSKLAAKWVIKLRKEQLQFLFSVVMFLCAIRTYIF
ncbi:sulfite exporter TauE/SafE family protein [Vibrio profundum]|uniref:sulfite exporter TauE/SafE family protein n=1 Tax=Vibrio profundum TaxID=2910247 RepID=UPI003D104C49